MVNQNNTKNEKPVSEKGFLPVVGIGASAGGLEAIEKFLEAVPPEPDMALVIIQHLSPDHTSMMDTLLKKYTSMKISTIKDNTRIESNHVYLNPSNMEVALYNGILMIKKYNGHDFSLYKPTNVLRRIERRLAIHKLDDIGHYVKYLEENPEEVSTLFKELLIKVTSFFRDPEAFEALKKEVIYELVKTKSSEKTLRIWVPGCATGEEAYSVCILMLEAMKDLDKHRPMQIFATDIDEEAIETARMGEYRESISMDVSEDRLNAFFRKDNNIYRVKKGVREKIGFAVQNIIEDPPFSKIDLICCRNLLIYLDRGLQEKLVPLFHYSLKEGGYLFLGYSETIGSKNDLFSAVNSKYKIYRASKDKLKKSPGLPPLPFSESSRDAPAVKTEKKAEKPGVRNLLQNVIINEYSPPAILITKDGSMKPPKRSFSPPMKNFQP